MKTRVAAGAPRHLLADDQNRVPLAHDADRVGGHSRQIHRDFKRRVSFVDVNGRGALPSQRLDPKDTAELEEGPSHLVRKVANLGGDGHDAAAHPGIIAQPASSPPAGAGNLRIIERLS
jgi:hypothetical protein